MVWNGAPYFQKKHVTNMRISSPKRKLKWNIVELEALTHGHVGIFKWEIKGLVGGFNMIQRMTGMGRASALFRLLQVGRQKYVQS